MTEVISVAIASNIYGTVFGFGIIAVIFGAIGTLLHRNVESEKIRCGIAIAILLCGIVCVCATYPVADIGNKTNIDAAWEKILENQKLFEDRQFYIKEICQKDFFEGSGEMDGGFLLIAGYVYGQIEMAEKQKLTLIYRENKTQQHKVMTMLLEDISIVTIGQNEKPYFKYSNSYIRKAKYDSNIFILESEHPVLYLPEGWQIIGARTNF